VSLGLGNDLVQLRQEFVQRHRPLAVTLLCGFPEHRHEGTAAILSGLSARPSSFDVGGGSVVMVNLFQTDDRVRPNRIEGKSTLPLPLARPFQNPPIRHPRESGISSRFDRKEIPAFAGMTAKEWIAVLKRPCHAGEATQMHEPALVYGILTKSASIVFSTLPSTVRV
jgi:hypothetical protein